MNKRVLINAVGVVLTLCILTALMIYRLSLSDQKSGISEMRASLSEELPLVKSQEPVSSSKSYPAGNSVPSSFGQAQPDDTPYSVSPDYSVLYSSQVLGVKILSSRGNIYVTSLSGNTIDFNTFKPIILKTDDSKMLVNEDSPLAEDYFPDNLVAVDSGKIKPEAPGIMLQSISAKALYSMMDAAARDNVKDFVLNSAYRSKSSQKAIFDYNLSVFKKSSKTFDEALRRTHQLVAAPGYSEHQTGLALDIFSASGRHRTDFKGTKEQLWLESNAYKYGFIIRYNKNKTRQTGATYEPWHFRFTGPPLSNYLYENDLCLEEFYEKIFSGRVLEGTNCIFMQICKGQKVFSDSLLYPKLTLEPVSSGVLLLTVDTGHS